MRASTCYLLLYCISAITVCSAAQSHYDVLGVDEYATPEQIKKAYRELALRWHPDKHLNSAESTAMFQTIQLAYNILSDPIPRAKYDADLERERWDTVFRSFRSAKSRASHTKDDEPAGEELFLTMLPILICISVPMLVGGCVYDAYERRSFFRDAQLRADIPGKPGQSFWLHISDDRRARLSRLPQSRCLPPWIHSMDTRHDVLTGAIAFVGRDNRMLWIIGQRNPTILGQRTPMSGRIRCTVMWGIETYMNVCFEPTTLASACDHTSAEESLRLLSEVVPNKPVDATKSD